MKLGLFILLVGMWFLSWPLQAQIPFEVVKIDSGSTAPAKPYGKAIGDLNGDGQPDLLVSSGDGDGMHWYEYPTWFKRTIRQEGSWSEDCQLTDIDQDGDLDIVNGNKAGLFWYENPLMPAGNPYSDVWEEHNIGSDGTNIHDLVIADLNLDKKPDIIVRFEKEHQRSVYVFLQTTPDHWSMSNYTNSSNKKGEGLAAGDLDDDGDLDMVIGNVWIENQGEGVIWAEHVYAENMPEQLIIKVADINQDGRQEIITAPQSQEVGNLVWYSPEKDVLDPWAAHTIQENISFVQGLEIADFNNDGFLDIHTAVRHDHSEENDPVSIWISDGKKEPAFTEQIIDTVGSHLSKVADIDLDGDVDIFGANWSGKNNTQTDILLWRNMIKSH